MTDFVENAHFESLLAKLKQNPEMYLLRITRQELDAYQERKAEATRLQQLAEAQEAKKRKATPKPKRSEMGDAQKASFIAEHGSDAYLSLPA